MPDPHRFAVALAWESPGGMYSISASTSREIERPVVTYTTVGGAVDLLDFPVGALRIVTPASADTPRRIRAW